MYFGFYIKRRPCFRIMTNDLSYIGWFFTIVPICIHIIIYYVDDDKNIWIYIYIYILHGWSDEYPTGNRMLFNTIRNFRNYNKILSTADNVTRLQSPPTDDRILLYIYVYYKFFFFVLVNIAIYHLRLYDFV